MKGSDKLIAMLNDLLADELTAINQYMVHSEMCDGWGYQKLHKSIEMRAIQEMKHAEKLIGRILFLEGTPNVSQLKPIHIGPDIAKQFANDKQAEVAALGLYNKAVSMARDLSDEGTRDMLGSILKDEEAHLDWLDSQLDQIAQVGVQNYLAAQLRKAE